MRRILTVGLAVASVLSWRWAPGNHQRRPDGNGHPEVGALLAQQAYSDGTWRSARAL